jgi:hypothetical protein
MRGIDARCRRDARRGPAEGLALAAVAWRVGWSGPGRAAVVALTVGWGVAADRTGPGPTRSGEGGGVAGATGVGPQRRSGTAARAASDTSRRRVSRAAAVRPGMGRE